MPEAPDDLLHPKMELAVCFQKGSCDLGREGGVVTAKVSITVNCDFVVHSGQCATGTLRAKFSQGRREGGLLRHSNIAAEGMNTLSFAIRAFVLNLLR